MHKLISIAGAALALAACGNDDQTANTQNVEQNLSAEDIVANDITAIDAVTASDANMAEDVEVGFTNAFEDGNAVGNLAAPAAKGRAPAAKGAAPAKSRPSSTPPAEPSVAEEPATNSQ